MRYLLLGGGIFGRNLALRLVELGAEAFVVDRNEDALEPIRDMVTGAIVAESTDRETLREIIQKYTPDGVIVCFGESFDATMLTVIYLKDFGVSEITARASNPMQGEILKRLGVKTVVLPEAMMGQRFADNIVLGESEQIILDSENSIARIRVPKAIIGKRLSELNAKKHGVSVLFVHREYVAHKVSKMIFPDEDPKFDDGDSLIIIGSPRRIAKFIEKISQ